MDQGANVLVYSVFIEWAKLLTMELAISSRLRNSEECSIDAWYGCDGTVHFQKAGQRSSKDMKKTIWVC